MDVVLFIDKNAKIVIEKVGRNAPIKEARELRREKGHETYPSAAPAVRMAVGPR
jgi:hypothetical protein